MAVLNLADTIFVIYVAFPIFNTNKVHPSHGAKITSLKVNKAAEIISLEYFDFANIFPPELVAKLLRNKKINNQTINLVDDKQPPYALIYSLRLVKLEISKTYIDINLVNGFIRSSKSPVDTLILFV